MVSAFLVQVFLSFARVSAKTLCDNSRTVRQFPGVSVNKGRVPYDCDDKCWYKSSFVECSDPTRLRRRDGCCQAIDAYGRCNTDPIRVAGARVVFPACGNFDDTRDNALGRRACV